MKWCKKRCFSIYDCLANSCVVYKSFICILGKKPILLTKNDFFDTLLQCMSLIPSASVSFALQGVHDQRPFPLQWRYLVLPYLGLVAVRR